MLFCVAAAAARERIKIARYVAWSCKILFISDWKFSAVAAVVAAVVVAVDLVVVGPVLKLSMLMLLLES